MVDVVVYLGDLHIHMEDSLLEPDGELVLEDKEGNEVPFSMAAYEANVKIIRKHVHEVIANNPSIVEVDDAEVEYTR